MTTTEVPISIRFPSHLSEAIQEFCRRTVRNKTGVVNAAVWYLLNRDFEEVDKILREYGACNGRFTYRQKQDLAERDPEAWAEAVLADADKELIDTGHEPIRPRRKKKKTAPHKSGKAEKSPVANG